MCRTVQLHSAMRHHFSLLKMEKLAVSYLTIACRWLIRQILTFHESCVTLPAICGNLRNFGATQAALEAYASSWTLFSLIHQLLSKSFTLKLGKTFLPRFISACSASFLPGFQATHSLAALEKTNVDYFITFISCIFSLLHSLVVSFTVAILVVQK